MLRSPSNTQYSILNPRRGVVIIELMMALSITVVALLAMVSLLAQSLGLNANVRDEYIGTYLAAEGIEIVKNIIDSNQVNGDQFEANTGDGLGTWYLVDYLSDRLDDEYDPSNEISLEFDENTRTYGYSVGNPTPFYRVVNAIHETDDTGEVYRIEVNSEVRWKARGGADRSVRVRDYFYWWWREF